MHNAVFDLRGLREPVEIHRFIKSLGHRLFAVNVLARRDRSPHRVKTLDGGLRIKVDGVLRIGECHVQMCCVWKPAKLISDGLELDLATP